jgi:cell division septation protein DedD
MTKKIIGSISILVGLGLATFILYFFVFQERDIQPPAPTPAEQPEVAVRPEPEAPPKPATPEPEPAVPPEPATPAPPEPEAVAPPEVAPTPTPTPLPAEEEVAPLTPLEPTEKHGLLAGRFRTYTSANKRMEKIKEQDIPALIRKEGKFYEVWAGPFETPEEAEQAQKSLRAALKISLKKGKLAIPVPK